MANFNDAIAVKQTSVAGEWTGHVLASYNVISVPNGGYLMAILLRALKAEQTLNDSNGNVDCLNLSCTFVNSADAGKDCRIAMTVIKRGRKVSSLQATLFQGDSRKILAVALFGKYGNKNNGAKMIQPAKREGFKTRVLKSRALGPLNAGEASAWGAGKTNKRAIFDRFQYRIQPLDKAVFLRMMSARGSEGAVPEPCPPEYRVWMRHENQDDLISVESLVQFVDAGIPTVKALLPFGDIGWVPTLQMDTTFYQEPRGDMSWALVHYYLESHSSDRVVEAADIYDPETQQLLCTAKQTGLLGIVQNKPAKL